MKCYSCGTENPDVEGVSNYDPDVDKPPYVKPEEVLREEEHHADFMFLRNLASSIGKGTTGNEWERTVEKRGLIIRSWPDFAKEKYGPERGLNCKLPKDSQWEKAIRIEEWAIARFINDSVISDALIDFLARQGS